MILHLIYLSVTINKNIVSDTLVGGNIALKHYAVLPASAFKKNKCFLCFFHGSVFFVVEKCFQCFFPSKCFFFLCHAGKSQVFQF